MEVANDTDSLLENDEGDVPPSGDTSDRRPTYFIPGLWNQHVLDYVERSYRLCSLTFQKDSIAMHTYRIDGTL